MSKFLILLVLSFNSFASYEAKIALGERLFNDVRFSKEFIQNSTDVNDQTAKGTSCVTCHQLDAKFDETTGLGMRTYADFTPQTEVPLRLEDKITETKRNTPGLVGIGSPYNTQRFSHWDGEFADHSETVLGNMTGRNMGWLPNEKEEALNNIIRVLQKDNGQGTLAQEFGGAYEKVFLGVDPSLPEKLRLKKEDRIDVFTATREEITAFVTDLLNSYLNDLDFERDEQDQYVGSPYDQFLIANGLPTAPQSGQSVHQYMIELRKGFIALNNPKFIAKKYFKTHGREFGFGPREWEGLKVFFNMPKPDGSLNTGMCLNCHKPPMFTDEKFHNVGTSQLEYDRKHGLGAFKKLEIPELADRTEMFTEADLGVWDFFAKKDKPELTKYMRDQFCGIFEVCTNDKVLPLMIARYKTPTLRNLNHSAPYFHNGSSPHLMHMLHEYKRASELMRAGELRNGAPQLRAMRLFHHEIHSLAPFLNSLNEEYD